MSFLPGRAFSSAWSLISGAIGFVFWTLMRRVVKHKKFLRNQFD
jgi:hypothetical protein